MSYRLSATLNDGRQFRFTYHVASKVELDAAVQQHLAASSLNWDDVTDVRWRKLENKDSSTFELKPPRQKLPGTIETPEKKPKKQQKVY